MLAQGVCSMAHAGSAASLARAHDLRASRSAFVSTSRSMHAAAAPARAVLPARSHGRRGAAIRAESRESVSQRNMKKSTDTGSLLKKDLSEMSFWEKCKTAIEIFFPVKQEDNARMDAKKRLRMILVADRCAMSPSSMSSMKESIVGVVSQYVDVEEDDHVDLSVTTDPDLGTVYSVSVPVKRVKPAFMGDEDGVTQVLEDDGVAVEWEDLGGTGDEDPAARFPFGT